MNLLKPYYSFLSALFIVTIIIIIIIMPSCRKNRVNTDASVNIAIEKDTVLFDTIFTTIGSTTKLFKIYNNESEKLIVSSIILEEGTNSMFRINVDGLSGVEFKEVEIPAKDSLFIFVEVTIDPNNQLTPFVVEDKIKMITNGNTSEVVLRAFGKNAYFHLNEIISSDITWPTDKPHVIYNFCAVDSAKTLTIPAGAEIHGYNNSLLYVYKGSLNVNGTAANPVYFSQSRSEEFLLADEDSTAGQWRGIYFFGARNSKIEYAEIKNATIGIQADTLRFSDSIVLENVHIHNSAFASIVTQGANVYANSCLFGNAGSYSGFISIGGSAFFDHCTFGNYWPFQRNSSALVVKDFYTVNNTIQYRPFNKAVFKNTIVYGENDTELFFDTLDRSLAGSIPNFYFDHCLVKTEDPVTDATFYNSCWSNLDPNFAMPDFWDFHTSSSAPVENKGTTTNPIPDFDGNGRSSSGNDLGCYND